MQKKILAAAVATSLVALGAGQAQAAISETGDVLVVPYYTTESGNDTLINVVNTSNTFKAIKVRFREARGSEDSLDFHVYMSPQDVWTAAMTQNADGVPTLVTSDTSCTFGVVGNNPATSGATVKTTYVDQANAKLGGTAYTGPAAEARIREGYVEIIEMATLTAPNPVTAASPTLLAHYAKHVNGTPRDCGVFGALNTQLATLTPADYLGDNTGNPAISFTYNTNTITIKAAGAAAGEANSAQFRARTGGLFANAAIINVDEATYIPMEVTVLDTIAAASGGNDPIFFSQSGETGTGLARYTADQGLKWVKDDLQFWDLPDLSTVVGTNGLPYGADSAGGTAAETIATVFASAAPYNLAAGAYDGTLAGPALAAAVEAATTQAALNSTRNRAGVVSQMMQVGTLANEFVIDPALNAETDWVVTLPTKRFFVTGTTVASGLVTDSWAAPGAAAVQNNPPGNPALFFSRGFNYATAQSCERVTVSIFDREEAPFTAAPGTGFSPGTPDAPQSICYEANVFSIVGGTNANVSGPSEVLGATTPRGAIAVGNFKDGWISMQFTDATRNANGLPAVGFAAWQFENQGFSASGALNVYGGGFRHRVIN